MVGQISAIRPPGDAPPWAASMLSAITSWVENIRRGPQALTPYATSSRPSATAFPRALAFESTLGAPIYSDTSGNWYVLANLTSATFASLAITAGAISSGTYTPTLFNVTNVAASTAYACQYIRVGNVVNVSGKVDVDPTLAAATVLGISLPIASTLSAAEKCAGVASSNTIASEVAAIDADTVNNRAQMDWVSVSLANHSMYFNFQYLVT